MPVIGPPPAGTSVSLRIVGGTTSALDLTTYMVLTEGEGFDPSPGFLDPQFNESPFGNGQSLVNIDVGNRELEFPLHLKAATKDSLHTLFRTLRLKLDESEVLVEWRDHGATDVTYYSIEFARFDADYRFFRSKHNWVRGMLRCWVRPYGHTATYRAMASGQAQKPLVRMTVTGILGDSDALAQHIVWTASANDHWAIVSRLPTGSALALYPAASLVSSIATLVGSVAVAGSQYRAWAMPTSGATQLLSLNVPSEDVKGIPHRVIAVVQSQHQQGAAFSVTREYNVTTVPFGATAIATSGRWQLIDLGLLSIPSSIPSSIFSLYVNGGGLASGAIPSQATQAILATYPLRINWMGILPDDDTTIVPVNVGQEAASYLLCEHSVLGFGAKSGIPVRFDDFSGVMRGRAPNLKPGVNTIVAGIAPRHDTVRSDYAFGASVRVQERFTFQR